MHAHLRLIALRENNSLPYKAINIYHISLTHLQQQQQNSRSNNYAKMWFTSKQAADSELELEKCCCCRWSWREMNKCMFIYLWRLLCNNLMRGNNLFTEKFSASLTVEKNSLTRFNLVSRYIHIYFSNIINIYL